MGEVQFAVRKVGVCSQFHIGSIHLILGGFWLIWLFDPGVYCVLDSAKRNGDFLFPGANEVPVVQMAKPSTTGQLANIVFNLGLDLATLTKAI